ncbi:hypothetical protein ACFW04_013730 [Cataglyphis niger]
MKERGQVEVHVVRTLKRIRQIIADIIRSYQCSKNIKRISTEISVNTYNKLLEAIKALFLIRCEGQERDQQRDYIAPRINSNSQYFIIIDNWPYCTMKGTATSIANHLGCSRNEEMRIKILHIHQEHPRAGHIMMQSYLKTAGIFISRHRIRETLNAIDPIGTASRWICETFIQTEPVVNFFANVINSYGLLSRVWSDHGYENLLVTVLMNTILFHNQRLWVDVFKEVCDSIYTELYSLEEQGLLDIENITHRFCVQYICVQYKNVYNIKMLLIKSYYHFNLHRIFIEYWKITIRLPLQYVIYDDIFDTNMTLYEKLSESLQTLGVDLSVPIINSNMNLFFSSFIAILQIIEEQKLHLEDIISSEEKYILCVNLLYS